MLTEHSIRLPNGVTLRYVEQGPAGAMPIILLHGFPDSWRSYETVLAHMPMSVRMIALSQRGFGNSDKPATGYNPRDLAADLAEFMKRRKIPEAVIVGHSMGALVAQRFAIEFPELAAGLVLIGTFPTLAGNTEISELIDALDQMKDAVDRDLVRDFQASTLAQPVSEAFFQTVVDEGARLPLSVWRAVMREVARYDDAAELQKITAPTRLYWGEHDSFSTHEQQRQIAAAIPNADLRVWFGAGHSLQWEEPKRFATELADFVRVLDQRRSKAQMRA
jgi:pimeloyl-ACP methyl ester carboxylesterase